MNSRRDFEKRMRSRGFVRCTLRCSMCEKYMWIKGQTGHRTLWCPGHTGLREIPGVCRLLGYDGKPLKIKLLQGGIK